MGYAPPPAQAQEDAPALQVSVYKLRAATYPFALGEVCLRRGRMWVSWMRFQRTPLAISRRRVPLCLRERSAEGCLGSVFRSAPRGVFHRSRVGSLVFFRRASAGLKNSS